MKKYLIVNADDFGLTQGVNQGIIYSHVNGIVTSASLFACLPASINAIELAKENPGLGIGVHLNYTFGKGIFPTHIGRKLFTPGGAPRFSIPGLWLASVISKDIRNEIYRLFQYQISWVIEHGIKVAHLNTHKHLHIWPWIADILIRLAKEFDIPAIRMPYEPPWISGPPNWRIRIYLSVLSSIFPFTWILLKKRGGINMPDRFRGIICSGFWSKERFNYVLHNLPYGITEIMTHPGYSWGLKKEDTRLISSRDTEVDILCDPDIYDYCQSNDIRLINCTCLQ